MVKCIRQSNESEKSPLVVTTSKKHSTMDTTAYFLRNCTSIGAVKWPVNDHAIVVDCINTFVKHIKSNYLSKTYAYQIFVPYIESGAI